MAARREGTIAGVYLARPDPEQRQVEGVRQMKPGSRRSSCASSGEIVSNATRHVERP